MDFSLEFADRLFEEHRLQKLRELALNYNNTCPQEEWINERYFDKADDLIFALWIAGQEVGILSNFGPYIDEIISKHKNTSFEPRKYLNCHHIETNTSYILYKSPFQVKFFIFSLLNFLLTYSCQFSGAKVISNIAIHSMNIEFRKICKDQNIDIFENVDFVINSELKKEQLLAMLYTLTNKGETIINMVGSIRKKLIIPGTGIKILDYRNIPMIGICMINFFTLIRQYLLVMERQILL